MRATFDSKDELACGRPLVDPASMAERQAAPAQSRHSISIVVPCYDEAPVIGSTVERLAALADALQADFDCELIFVDDGSVDGTRRLLRQFATRDPRIRLLCLARNFGHQLAVTAGIDAATGDAIVLIDADLQDPPELVHQMVAKWREGFDVVYGTRMRRAGETSFKRVTAYAFYRLLNWMSDVHIPADTGDFRLISRRVAEAVRAMPERHRFLRGMVSWTGFRQAAIPYERAARPAGASKYGLWKMLSLAADAMLSFSTKPLQIATALGLLSATVATAGILYALAMRLFTNVWVEGWTTLMIAVLFLGGMQLICLGIVGQYVGRMYMESKRRPLYLVEERFGFTEGCGGQGAGCVPVRR
ncbi:glycosyltransferase family 2 protein [Roseateles sp.]|uniref:glycosyltransferase family 2 protein n=1 Tax=Roseateles sp. TaxID=1971397 RepID=UPI0032662D2C